MAKSIANLDSNIVLGLRELRQRISRANVPRSALDESLNIATWNIRAFGKRARSLASLHFIAEIIGRFDLVSVAELDASLHDLEQVLEILGRGWDVVFSDCVCDPNGNSERMAFVFDKRAVKFTGLAGHVQAPSKPLDGEPIASLEWWRAPYMASFRAGKLDFIMLSAHIRWGGKSQSRLGELQRLAAWVTAQTTQRFVHEHEHDLIVVGDFDIPNVRSELYAAVTSHGLRVPEALLGQHGSMLAQNKRYDQMLHLPRYAKAFTNVGGVLDFYVDDYAPLYPNMPTLTKGQFTFELSDHLPLWMQVDVDRDGEVLDYMLARWGEHGAGAVAKAHPEPHPDPHPDPRP